MMVCAQQGRRLPARVAVLLLLPVLLLGGNGRMMAHAEVNDSDPVRIACVGDSITYGMRIEDRERHSYPAVLERLAGDGVNVLNAGVSGTTLLRNGNYPYWTTAAFRDATAFEPDVVIIKLGTNDTKLRNWQHRDEFAGDLRAMIEHFADLPSEPRIWVCLPVPMYGALRSLNDRTLRRELIPVIREVASEQEVPVIDLYSALDDAPEYFPDGVHPNADGARRIAETVWEAVRDEIRP